MEPVDVLRPLPLRQVALGPREREVDVRVESVLGRGHGRPLFDAAAQKAWATRSSRPPRTATTSKEMLRPCGLGMAREPRLRRSTQASLLLRVHHLERVSELVAELLLHLAEHEPSAASDDDVELMPAGPRVGREDPVPAQAVPPDGATFGA